MNRPRLGAGQVVVACGPPRPGGPHATTWRSGDVVHGVGNLDLVAGVAAEQVAVLVTEVGDDLVTLAGDVLAGAGLVLDRRAARRFGAVQVAGGTAGLRNR